MGLRISLWVIFNPQDVKKETEGKDEHAKLWQGMRHLYLQVNPLSQALPAKTDQAILGLTETDVAWDLEA